MHNCELCNNQLTDFSLSTPWTNLSVLNLPNPWGPYDMEDNVWEWTQDWLGDFPAGTVVDPTGPPSNPIGWKVIRGGGYEFAEPDCRSLRRYFFGNHPALHDTNLGFRVVPVRLEATRSDR